MTELKMRPRYSKEEFARRGEEIFNRAILDEDPRKVVVIDIETGDYEIDHDQLAACDRLEARQPDAQIWARRVGSPYLYRIRRFKEVA